MRKYCTIIKQLFIEIKEEYGMRKRVSSTIILLFIFLLSLTLLTGCAKPPTQEVENAEKAITQAKQKEADLYVQDEFRKAVEALQKAKDLIINREYKEAKASAEASANSALKAISFVEMNKATLKEEAEKMVQEVQQSLGELKTIAATAIKKKAPFNKEEVQGAIGKYELDIMSVKDQLQEQKIRGAYDQLVSLKEQIKVQKENLTAALEQKQETKK